VEKSYKLEESTVQEIAHLLTRLTKTNQKSTFTGSLDMLEFHTMKMLINQLIMQSITLSLLIYPQGYQPLLPEFQKQPVCNPAKLQSSFLSRHQATLITPQDNSFVGAGQLNSYSDPSFVCAQNIHDVWLTEEMQSCQQ
jgi:CRISPR/Cas system-associated endoribonuclease Cas2